MYHRHEDFVLTSARREAVLVFAIWLAACIYSVGVCYRFGYGRDAATLTYVLGFPDWVFWGVVVPWTVCTMLCFILAYFVITDEDLGEEQAEEQLSTRSANAAPEGDYA
jgi:uncharacterized protein DUF997